MTESFTCRQKRKMLPVRRVICFFVLLFCLVFILINHTLCPAITSLAVAESRNRIEDDIANTVYRALGSDGIPYDTVFSVTYKADGSVSAMNVNMARAYAICADVVPKLTERARNEEAFTVSIPLGTLSSIPALSGKGPCCTIRMIFSKAVSVRMESDFSEAGINQTLHRISMVVTANVTLLVPGSHTDVKNEVKIPIAETVLLGKVPDAYTEIHRLTDDITETDIDDIYDFGATK